MLLSLLAFDPFEHEAKPTSVSKVTRGMILLKNFRGFISAWLSVQVDRQAAEKAARQ